jgi:NADPH-dependent 2,4-dienoyl-CoA reductase/sulfur reductase-like enzyme
MQLTATFCEQRMQTNVADVYAAGDVTQFPLFLANDELANIQHWQMAHQHGRVCGLNIAGVTTDIQSVPFFWTVVCGKSIRYCGYGAGFDDIVIHGDLAELKFTAFYTKADKVIAVASMNFDPVVAQAAEVFLHGPALTKTEISTERWSDCLKELSSRLQTTTHF